MICELCGRAFNGGKRVRIEGSIVVACDSCARLGEVVGPATPIKKPAMLQPKKPAVETLKVETTFDLIEGYGNIIKSAREKKNLKQEELGRLINEPASFIHHIETGQAEPSMDVAKKIQSKLGVRLLTPHVEDDEDVKNSSRKGMTLGDIVIVKKRKKLK